MKYKNEHKVEGPWSFPTRGGISGKLKNRWNYKESTNILYTLNIPSFDV